VVFDRSMVHGGLMLVVSIGMLCALALAVAIVVAVALPARREGRDVLTPQGGETLKAVRDKVADVIPGVPSGSR
jgi:hypothetical protein